MLTLGKAREFEARRLQRHRSREWMPSSSGQRWPSSPTAPPAASNERATGDVKGKSRAYDYEDGMCDVIAEDMAQDALLQEEELDAMAKEGGPGMAHDWTEPGPSSRSSLNKAVQDAGTTARSHAETSQGSSNPSPSSLGVTDRFDWRLTASSFRRIKVANAHKIRKPPSASVLAATDTRSPELQARVQAYQDRLAHLVGIERAFERAEWERLRSRSQDELIAGGWTMDGLVGYWQGGGSSNVHSPLSKRQKQQLFAARSKPRVAIMTRTGLQKLGWSRLKEGDKVELRPSLHTRKAVQEYLPKEEVTLPPGPASKKAQNSRKTAVTELPPKTEELRLVATVLSSDAYRLHLLFTPPHTFVDLESCQSWRLDLAPNEVIDAKVDEAIESLGMDLAGLEARDVDAKWEARGSSLTESLLPRETEALSLLGEDAAGGALGQSSIFEPDWRIRSWYERYSRSAPLIMEDDPDLSLNESQLKAVATMLSSRLSLIQGPPGTGKTHTLVSTIKLLKHHFAVPHPVLLCAHTNVAVDNLVDGAINAGLNVVRVGPSNSVSGLKSGRIEEVTLEKKMEKRHLWPRLEETKIRMGITKRQITALYEREKKRRVEEEKEQSAEILEATAKAAVEEQTSTSNSASNKGSPSSPGKSLEIAALRKSLGRLAQQAFILTRQIQTTILYEADVVCSTLISSSSASLKCIDFPLVFIDECTQALEVLSLLPLMKGARQVALIGDHKQLPPVLRSKEGKKEGGARSLFERLVEEDGWASAEVGDGDSSAASTPVAAPLHRRTKMQMLQVQHRMHPILASFPNERFYAGQLQSAPRTQDVPVISHSLADSATLSSKGRLVFLDHTGLESVARSASEVSLCNMQEIELLLHLLYDLLTSSTPAGQGPKAGSPAKLSGSSIGIIAPYLAQSRLIGRLLRPLTEQDAVHPMRRLLEERLGPSGVKELEKVEVNTVDGFQGREKEVIIFSAVRCSAAAVAAAASTSSASASGLGVSPDQLDNQQQQEEEKKYPVGFLADARRLNVALTRAKSALFVLGNLHTWRNAAVPGSGSEGEGAYASASASASADSLRTFAEHVAREGTVVSGDEVRRLIGLLPAAVPVQEEPPEILKGDAEGVAVADVEGVLNGWDGAMELLPGGDAPAETAAAAARGGVRGFAPSAGEGGGFGRAF